MRSLNGDKAVVNRIKFSGRNDDPDVAQVLEAIPDAVVVIDIDFPWSLAQTIYQHHERLDGSGYPQGLKGEAILLEARILAVADVVDAICCFRPYRPAAGLEAAQAELNARRGTWYDPAVVDACIKVLTEGKVDLDCRRTKPDAAAGPAKPESDKMEAIDGSNP